MFLYYIWETKVSFPIFGKQNLYPHRFEMIFKYVIICDIKIFLVENYRRQYDIYSASFSKAQSYNLLRVPRVSNRLFTTVLVTGQ